VVRVDCRTTKNSKSDTVCYRTGDTNISYATGCTRGITIVFLRLTFYRQCKLSDNWEAETNFI